MNKDASIEIVKSVEKHPGADSLDLVSVLGYTCVSKIGLYRPGDVVIYIRTDTVLPDLEWATDYKQYAPNRVKCIKLRGIFSEGILMPISEFWKILNTDQFNEIMNSFSDQNIILENDSQLEGYDVSNILSITHYEPPYMKNNSNGGSFGTKGSLPYHIPKTDESRVEGLRENNIPYGELVDIQLKIDGQSCSFGYKLEEDRFFVLSRNLEIDETVPNNFTAHIERYDIKNKLIDYCQANQVSLCIRGESYGTGIQDSKLNPHSKLDKGWAMFSVWNIDKEQWEEKDSDYYFLNVADELKLPIAPMLFLDLKLTPEIIETYSKNIEKIQMMDTLEPQYFEGVVVKHSKGSFKIINKYYDSKK